MNDLSPPASIQECTETEELDQATLEVKLAGLRALKNVVFKDVTVSVYVVEISKINKFLRCKEAALLECDPELLEKFLGYVTSRISEYKHISNFSEITTNQDNRFFYIHSSETDFPQILKTMHPSQDKEDVGIVSSLEELEKFNAYVIEIYRGSNLPSLYAFRYISQSWSPKNSSGGFFKLNDDMVATFDESPIFRIDQYLDFIVCDDDLFIMNCEKFEAALQYRNRLIEIKNDAVVEIKKSSIFVSDGDVIFSSIIGEDKHFLRQLSAVQKKGFYKNPVWVDQLKEVAKAAGNWLLEFDLEGKIVVKNEKAYVRELLTVLQNKRVQTVVDKKIFDVDGELVTQITRKK